MRTNVQIFCTLILKTGVLYDTMEVWKKEGRKRRFETPPRRGLKARREVCLRGGSRGVQKSFMQNASARRRQMAARSFLCPNAANKRTCTGSAFPHAGRGRAKAAGGARGWQTVLPQVRQDLHRGALIRMLVAAGQKRRGSAWVANRPAASKTRLAPGERLSACRSRQGKSAGGAHGWQTVLPQVRQDLRRGELFRMQVAAGQKRRGRVRRQAL